jgi:dTDP-4-amino-4,6-dideoxygalactose transaminase
MIPSSIYYSHPIYHHKPYKKYKVTCRVTEKVSKQVLSLPMHPYLIESDQEKIVGVIKKFIER